MADKKQDIPKAYEASEHEGEIYKHWEKSGYFNPDKLPGERTQPFTIIMPPPNVTGTLHLGHAVMLAVEDLMIRFERMRGKKTLWLPGTDHAAIATQTKVEKLLLKEEKKTRHDLGREKFLKRVEKFASESHDTIVDQVRKMGSSCDWSREAYTLDDERRASVNEAFKRLYDMGLLYRGSRVINWCPRCSSTLADDEVKHKEGKTTLYTFKYSKELPFAIATTRPETKLGDTAIAVHPDDDRYKKYIGEQFDATFLGIDLHLKVVANHNVDPDFGTGTLGVTPAHSQIDEEIARENDLPSLQIINEEGNMTTLTGKYEGMSVLDARAKIVGDLQKEGLIEGEEEVDQNLSICYRCDTPIEPLPKLQWFIAVNKHFSFQQSKQNPIKGIEDGQEVTLKEVMSHVVRTGQIKIVPDRFEKNYFHWIDNLRDWCVSRQLWFGHRVPVWYHPDHDAKGGEAYVVGETSKEKGWTQDPDTLDTWFSSGLWTFSTLGWPSKTKDFRTYHPTSVLETGYDILFFWIARMVLMSTALTGEIPFRNVYLHGLVRDEQGRKMSKSLDNTIDPLDMIKKFGTDAVRLSLVIGTTPGNDTRLSEEKISGYRNFTNKLWNIGRFVLTTTSGTTPTEAPAPHTLADKWIMSRLAAVTEKVTASLETYAFSQAGEVLRDFTWGEFADWYLEIAKVQKANGDDERTDAILRYVLKTLLRLWHPFMPFVTEALWSKMDSDDFIMISDWPIPHTTEDTVVVDQMKRVQNLVVTIRNMRAEQGIPVASKIDVTIAAGSEIALIEQQSAIISKLARIADLAISESADKKDGDVAGVSGSYEIFLRTDGRIDTTKQRAKLEKDAGRLEKYIQTVDKKLSNKEFLKNAPEIVVQAEKEKRGVAAEELLKIQKQLGK